MYTTDLLEKVQFLNGTFAPTEARDILFKVIDDQIKFYKIQNLGRWMKNHDCEQESCNQAIEQLKQKKSDLAAIIREAQEENGNITLRGDFIISLDR